MELQIAWERLKGSLIELSHSYIEICKVPGLRLARALGSENGEVWADNTKYIIGYSAPVIAFILIEWLMTGSLL